MVGKVKVPYTSETVEIFLNRNDISFFARVDDKILHGNAYKELEAAVVEAVKAKQPINWIPVITVGIGPIRNREDAGDILFVIKREYIAAVGEDKRIMWISWSIAPEERAHLMQRFYHCDNLVLPYHRVDMHVFPYSDELWEQLLHLQKTILGLKSKLDTYFAGDITAGTIRILADSIER